MKNLILNIAIILLVNIQVSAQLVISPESSITITDGTSLFIGTSLYIKSDVNGSGHLADQNLSGNTYISGDISIERYLTADGWHNVSAPLNNIISSAFTSTDLIFYYDETIILNDWNFGWVWYEGPLSLMRGYDIYLPSTSTTTYYAPSNNNLNTGTYSHNITRTNPSNGEVENRKGWNLLGNPYPSPVDWLEETGWDKTDINDAKYIWNPNNNNYTIFLGGASPTGINGATQYIPSNQGFWVQAVQNGSVQINNSARVGLAEGTPGYYKKSSADIPELRLLASGNGYTDETLIRFLPESTVNFDKNLDASKLFTVHDSVPQINTKISGELLAINTLPELVENLIVLLDFSCNTSGDYIIYLSNNSTIDSWNKIFLKDKTLGKVIDLTQEREYKFYHHTSNTKNRFSVLFNPSQNLLNNIQKEDSFTVTSIKNTVTVVRNSTEFDGGIINIYNLLGQKITTENLEPGTITNINLDAQSGYYIASIIINNQCFNYKIKIAQ